MNWLLALSRLIDALNERVGQLTYWLVSGISTCTPPSIWAAKFVARLTWLTNNYLASSAKVLRNLATLGPATATQ